MLRYEFNDTTSTRIRSCRECLDSGFCDRYSRKASPFGECMYGRFTYKHPEVTDFNVTWILLQIKRGILGSRVVAESALQKHRLDTYLFPEEAPTIEECQIFVEVMIEFMAFIRKREEEYNKLKRGRTNTFIAFVNSIINTKIKVEGKEVMVYSKNEPLNERIKKVTLKNKCIFRTINSEEEAKSWWVPIMNVS